MALHPIPYYIVALLLLIVFGYLWPVLPISGGSHDEHAAGAGAGRSSAASSATPSCRSLSLVLVGLGGWFMGMRSLVSNIVTEDYVVYAELAGVERRRILASYVMRNALVPQVTGLAMSLGAIFNGAIITEQVFGYPGIGTLLVVGGLCRRLQPGARRHHDLDRRRLAGRAADRPSLSAARSAREGPLAMGRAVLATSCATTANSQRAWSCWPWSPASPACRSSRPIRPTTASSCRPTCRRRWDYWFGTTSRGQDVFWLLTFAIRNTLLFGIVVAVLSRLLALADRAGRRLLGRLGRPRPDVDQRHLHRHPAVPDPGAVLLRACASTCRGACWR